MLSLIYKTFPLIRMITKGLVAHPCELCQYFNFGDATRAPINTILKTAQF